MSIFTDKQRGKEVIVGVHPKVAEDLVESCLQKNLLSVLPNIRSYRRECTITIDDAVHSRFDFSGVDESGKTFLMEVKNVPLADFEDVSRAELKKLLKTNPSLYAERAMGSKVSYFPDGYRKKSSEPVSPRALKHIRELTYIKKLGRGIDEPSEEGRSDPIPNGLDRAIDSERGRTRQGFDRCLMCYVIQRTDVNRHWK